MAAASKRLASVDEDSQTFTEVDMEELSFLKHGIPEHYANQEGTRHIHPKVASFDEDMTYSEDGDESSQVGLVQEGELNEAAGGELQTTRLVLKKQVHKKTVIRDGKEETIVTEDTHVEQDNEGPEELRENMQRVVDDFMEGKELDAPDQQ